MLWRFKRLNENAEKSYKMTLPRIETFSFFLLNTAFGTDHIRNDISDHHHRIAAKIEKKKRRSHFIRYLTTFIETRYYCRNMTDITNTFVEIVTEKGKSLAKPEEQQDDGTKPAASPLPRADEFVKEAYRIVI